MGAPDSVYELVEKFDRHKPNSETALRVSFVDPLFEALGWDRMDPRQVRHEPRVPVREAGFVRSKRADYSFHIGNTRHFFVETKMPHVNLERNPIPAFQLRRYGWSGNTPVSVLTDFEEFSVYDCRIQPRQSDPASTARLTYYRYEEYIDKWAELEARFSREAVASGALREWVEGERARGFFRVDQAFLREMEDWRESLAKVIALHNRGLSQRQLNNLVQRTIDRIVFLRIAEDRDIEAYGRLRSATEDGRQVYAELKRLFKEADDKYNSGLFHFGADERESDPDTVSLSIHIDNEPLRHIITNLYFPHSPYEFSVLPADILGQVYERFLGKVIELGAGGAVRIEDKPEVRKGGGVYYTPTYIVDYIVENTVGGLLEGKTPADAETLRILDPACGSGSFLVGAYQYLLDWHLAYYREHPRQYRNRRRETADGMILTTAEKRRILQENIYGVDLDQNAVEVSKLSLLLKMLENEDSAEATGLQTLMFSAGERILPDLSGNIKWGNSLIGSDFFRGPQAGLFDNEEAMLKVKAFDWAGADGFPEIMAAGGFDAVIGNPPYIRIQTMKETAPATVPYYKANYVAASKGNYDIYVVFVEQGLRLLNEHGLLGYILPHKFFNAKYGQPLRSVISSGNHLSKIVHFGDQQIFDGATTYTCLLFLRKKETDEFHYMSIDDIPAWTATGGALSQVFDAAYADEQTWTFVDAQYAPIYRKLKTAQAQLGDIARLFVGLQTDADSVYILDEVRVDGNKVLCLSKETGKTHWLEDGHLKHLLKGSVNIARYQLRDVNRRLIFPYKTIGGKSVLIPVDEYEKMFPLTWAYLQENYDRLSKRHKGRLGENWYGYVYKKNHTRFGLSKLVVPSLATGSAFAEDLNGRYYFVGSGGGGGGGYGIVLNSPNIRISELYLLGVLNSKLLSSYLRQISTSFRGGYIALNRQYIEQLPIRTVDFNNPADVAMHDQMVELVDEMLDRHKQLPGLTGEGRKIAERLIETVDSEIDALVYRLYGLSEDEIAIVEGAGG